MSRRRVPPPARKDASADLEPPAERLVARGKAAAAGAAASPGKWTNKPAAVFMLAWFIMMMSMRVNLRGVWGLADALWACNAGLLIAAYGAWSGNALMISTSMMMVVNVHLAWVVDLLTYIGAGFWPLGAAKYMGRVSYLEAFTSLHHIWFIPLCMAMVYHRGGITLRSWGLAILLFMLLSIPSRILPLSCTLHNGKEFILNINHAHRWPTEAFGAWFGHLANDWAAPAYLLGLGAAGFVMTFPGNALLVLIASVF